jgi:hypothetical protein
MDRLGFACRRLPVLRPETSTSCLAMWVVVGTTVLTVEGLDFGIVDLMPRVLRRFATADGRTRQRVRFPASTSKTSISAGVTALDRDVRATQGEKVVLAHSQGAQVASGWLRGYADKPDAPPAAELSFILIGNPQRRLGGRPNGKGFDGKPLHATPDDTQYRVVDICRRWDGWANADNWPDHPDVKARVRLLLGMMFDHSHYDGVGVNDPANRVRAVVGNTIYIVAP